MTAPAGFMIRAATYPDLAAIRHIERAAFEPSRRASSRALRRALHSAFQRVRVLEVGGRVAGYLIVWPHPHTWRIYNLATDPQWRRQGVAGALVAAAIREAAAHGARRVVLESRSDGPLVDFYRQRGFTVERRLPGYYAEGEDAVRMALELPAPD